MKKIVFTLSVAVAVFTVVAYVSAGMSEIVPSPEEVVMVGEVIDIASYGMLGRLGEENRESGLYRAKNGFPIGILEEETGKIYIAVYRVPVPAAGLTTANGVLSPFMGQKVVISGIKYSMPGLNMVQVSIVSEYY